MKNFFLVSMLVFFITLIGCKDALEPELKTPTPALTISGKIMSKSEAIAFLQLYGVSSREVDSSGIALLVFKKALVYQLRSKVTLESYYWNKYTVAMSLSDPVSTLSSKLISDEYLFADWEKDGKGEYLQNGIVILNSVLDKEALEVTQVNSNINFRFEGALVGKSLDVTPYSKNFVLDWKAKK